MTSQPGQEKVPISQGLVTVTHLWSYTNSNRRYRQKLHTPPQIPLRRAIYRRMFESFMMFYECFMMFYECFMMFYQWFTMFYQWFTMFSEVLQVFHDFLRVICNV